MTDAKCSLWTHTVYPQQKLEHLQIIFIEKSVEHHSVLSHLEIGVKLHFLANVKLGKGVSCHIYFKTDVTGFHDYRGFREISYGSADE